MKLTPENLGHIENFLTQLDDLSSSTDIYIPPRFALESSDWDGTLWVARKDGQYVLDIES